MPPGPNPLLPRPGIKYEYSLEELQEYAKCATDPVYFIKKYMKIIQVDKGLVPFDMYDFQEEMVRSYHENRFNITLCSRQVGKSTTVIGYFLWCMLFNKNYACCISANKQKVAVDLLGRLKLAYEHLPRFLQQGVTQWARLEIELENGSRCFAAATSSSAVRGGSYNILLLDEYAFVPPNVADEFYASTFPTISSGKETKIIMVSTPNGMNGFHKFWVDAKAKRNDFVPIFVHWSQVPGRDEQWREITIRNIGGEEKFAQEYECSFLTTAYTLIEGRVLTNLVHNEPVYTEEGGKYQEFISPVKYNPEKPDSTPQRVYIILIDVGHGEDKDASTFHVVDITALPYKICATYRNATISTMSFPATIMRYARKYEQFINGNVELPFLMVEAMDVGRDVAYILNREYGYPNMLATEMVGKEGQTLRFGINERRHPGLRMSAGAKKSAGAVLKTLVENQQIIINDLRVVQELSTFVRRGATYEADYGHHDDMVTPLMILSWITLQPSFAEITTNRSLETYVKQAVDSAEGDTIEVTFEQPLPFAAVNGMGGGYQIPGEYVEDDDPNWLLA